MAGKHLSAYFSYTVRRSKVRGQDGIEKEKLVLERTSGTPARWMFDSPEELSAFLCTDVAAQDGISFFEEAQETNELPQHLLARQKGG